MGYKISIALLTFQLLCCLLAIALAENSRIETEEDLVKYEEYLKSELRRVELQKRSLRKKRSIDAVAPKNADRNNSFITRILPLKEISVRNETSSESKLSGLTDKISSTYSASSPDSSLLSATSSPDSEAIRQRPNVVFNVFLSLYMADNLTDKSVFFTRHIYIFQSSVTTECQYLTQPELVAELKQKGTYNPDLMAWDVLGILRFIDKAIHDQYQKEASTPRQLEEILEKNTNALKHLLTELNVTCGLTDTSVRSRLRDLSLKHLRRSIISPSLRRSKRTVNKDVWMSLMNTTFSDVHRYKDFEPGVGKQQLIGESHSVPFGCDKRGTEEDGYLRLCGACQTIRHLPETFFPPFINEVTCDSDKACLYFYDYPHGKCRQKHMNFAVLKNVGTKNCQNWKKYNLNVRVSCECFVDEMSFFSKYI